ncbi:MAG: FAD-binding oxidoreductase, partial [Planctomycetota bacterium]|nr:FAD-binding oxidoreductase [Planctomycetota bacterium]
MQNDQQSSTETSSDVIDYPARDMTITVGALMTIGRLREVLKHENQQLPIDIADDTMTVGELVARDISGPQQFGYGTLRDYLIGIEAIDGTGRVFHAGGRVVKNVAGYDLCRLLIGAEGKLGLLRQLTFKLKPLPVEQHLSVAGFRTLKDLDSALDRSNLTSTMPQILDVLNPAAAESLLSKVDNTIVSQAKSQLQAYLVLGFDGSRKACDWQTKTIAEELHGTADFVTSVARPGAVADYCRSAMEFAAGFKTAQSGWSAKVVTLPSHVVSVLQVAKDFGLLACGRAGNGIVYLRENSTVDAAKLRNHLTSIVDAGFGCVEIRESDQIWKHPAVTPQVERYSNMLHELLG